MSRDNKKFWFSKLGIDIIIGILIAILVTGGFLVISRSIMNNILYKYFKESDYEYNEAKKTMDSLQSYITKNKIKSTDKSEIDNWVENNNITFLALHTDETNIFESRNQVYEYAPHKREMEDRQGFKGKPKIKDENKFYYKYQEIIKFTDKKYKVIIINNYTDKYWKLGKCILEILCVLIFLILLFKSLEKHISYINKLENEVMILQSGSLEYPITIKENNEITNLALSIEEMRLSFIERLENENNARKSNDDLITAMSHDLRTPLTTLIAYLDILYLKKYKNQSEASLYIKRARDKSYQIKKLSDKLFEYFLAFNNDEKENINISNYNGNMLIDQIIIESTCLLEEENIKIIYDNNCKMKFNIYVNLDFLRRVFDNIFSNIKKYADKDKEVSIKTDILNNYMVIEFTNYCLKETKKIESNNIGLKSSKKLMENMNGMLEFNNNGNIFITKIKIPKI